MFRELASLHASYNIYPRGLLNVDPHKDIVVDIKKVKGELGLDALDYLGGFYDSYRDAYKEYKKENIFQEVPDYSLKEKIAGSVDLPFIGPGVLENGHARYFFVLEGSLGYKDILSVSVLSCLWLFNNVDKLEYFFDKYWMIRKRSKGNRRSYTNIQKALVDTPQIAWNSYATDAIRVANDKGKRDLSRNRELLAKEIDLLNPDIVIAVGVNAKNIVGWKKFDTMNSKYVHVTYPSYNGKKKGGNIWEDEEYKQLREKININEKMRGMNISVS